MRLYYLTLCLALVTSSSRAQVLESADDNFGTCSATRDNSNGTVVLTTGNEPVRVGSRAFKHSVVPPPSGIKKRAELDCGGFSEFDPNEVYWYGFSLYLPAADFPSSLNVQFVNQLRFSNIPWGGYSVPNCNMNKVCGRPEIYGGSGHELLFENGQLNFYLRHQEPGCADCEALDEVVFNLGTAPLDQWVDFVYQGDFTGERDGIFRIWMQVNGGGYQLVADHRGRSWVENHPPGSELADLNGPNPFAPRVSAPNYTVGLYYNDDNANRTMYSDHVTLYQQEAGVDGFRAVSVGGVGPATACATRDQPCDDGDGRTNDDRFDASCTCVGVLSSLEVTPASLEFGIAAATQPLNVISNTAWTIADDASWLTLSAASGSNDGSIATTVTENTTGADRTATITVTDGFSPVTTTVTQSGTSCGPTPWTTAATFADQSGSFTLDFDLRVIGADVNDAVLGVTDATTPTEFDDNAALVRLNPSGVFDVRDGGTYRSDATVATSGNTTYAVSMAIDASSGTYDVTVTPPDGAAVKIADDYAFRTTWNGSLPLNAVSTVVIGTGCLEVQNLSAVTTGACTTTGDACDDGNACTVDDVRDVNCNCVGTLRDGDGDGICDDQDPCDGRTVGNACDDGDPNTSNDVIGADCTCAGVAACSGSQLELAPSQDAELREENKDTNYDDGNGDRLRVQERGGDRDRHGLFQWNLSDLPAGANVEYAALAFEFFNFQADYPVDFTLLANETTWSESTVTWNSAPAAGAELARREGLGRDIAWEVPVTAGVLAALDDGRSDFGARLVATAPSVGPDNGFVGYAEFDLRDGTRPDYRPRLIVCYSDACTPGTPCDDGDVNTENDVLSANCACAGTPVDFACDGTALRLTPSADAGVDEENPDANSGSADRARTQLRGGGRNQEAYLQFDLSAIPANATLTGANVELVPFNYAANIPTPLDVELYGLQSAFDESTITWNNRPTRGSLIDTEDALARGDLWQVNLRTEVAASLAAGMPLGLNIVSVGPAVAAPEFTQFLDWKSKESDDAGAILPQLNVCYTATSSASEAIGLREVTLYPNPTTGNVELSLPGARKGDGYIVTDAIGRTVATGALDGETSSLDFGALHAGSYQIAIRRGSEMAVSRLVIVE